MKNNNRKLMVMPKEYEDMLNNQLQEMMKQLEILGIKRKQIPKTKLTELLIEKIKKDEEKNKKAFLSLF